MLAGEAENANGLFILMELPCGTVELLDFFLGFFLEAVLIDLDVDLVNSMPGAGTGVVGNFIFL